MLHCGFVHRNVKLVANMCLPKVQSTVYSAEPVSVVNRLNENEAAAEAFNMLKIVHNFMMRKLDYGSFYI